VTVNLILYPASIRQRIIVRKFANLWRQRAWQQSLNRRAKNRRQKFAETMKAEEARKQRNDEELEEILKAAQESMRLQREIEESTRTPQKTSVKTNSAEMVKVAGQKRKSFSGQDLKADRLPSSNGSVTESAHKRSKTMSSSLSAVSTAGRTPPVSTFRLSASRPPPHVSIFSRSAKDRAASNSDSRASRPAQKKLDTTRTDYFRLKAMGIDPDTPFVPDTKQGVEARRRMEEAERQAILARARRRHRNSSSRQSSPTSMPPPEIPRLDAPTASPTTTTPRPIDPIAEDDFLKQIREARKLMAEETEWLKTQSTVLEKEIEQEEEFRQSQSSRNGDASSPYSSSGLPKSNGYEYLPADTTPGARLSRTEVRIRRTGAHGLATKPLRSRSQYIPVAMSMRTARDYTSSAQSSPGGKRSHDEVEPPHAFVTRGGKSYVVKRPRGATRQTIKAPVQKVHASDERNGSRNSFQALQSLGPDADYTNNEDDTEELLEEDDDEQEEADERGPYPSYHRAYGANGNYPEAHEDEGEEVDEEPDAEEEENDDDELAEEDDDGDHEHMERGPPGQAYMYEEEELGEEDHRYEYGQPRLFDDDESAEEDEDEDVATPATNPQISRAASSAPGGSADDAFVIDDSD
jgi:hypothetical protein